MIKIRKVEDKDLIPLSEFLPKGFPSVTQKIWLQLFEYWWSTNPAYSDQTPRGWLIEKDEAIVGFIGNIPVNILVDGEVKPAVTANNWYLDPSVRGIYSLKIFNEFIQQKNISVFLFRYGNDRFKRFLSRCNFKEFILPQFQREYIYIFDKKKMNVYTIAFILVNKLNPKLLGKLPELLRRLGSLTRALIFQKSLVQGNDALDEAYTSTICTVCDGSFLSMRHSNHRNDDIEIFYDVKTLNWLYFSERGTSNRMVIQCKRSSDNSLAGYVVFDMYLHNIYGEMLMELVDSCIENENLQVLKSLIAYAVEIGKQNNIKLLILCANSPNIDAYLWSAIGMNRSVQNYRYIRFSDSDALSSLNNDWRNVYFPLIWPPQ